MAKKLKGSKPGKSIKNAMIVNHGLQEALLGLDIGSFGTQLNQMDTLFLNERWYLLSNFRQLLSQMYVEHGLVRTLVRVPVDDAFRGGLKVKTDQITPEQLSDLQADIEREGVLYTMADGMVWQRLFGGGGIVIMTDQDPATPLNLAAIRPDSPLKFRDAELWELFFDQQNTTEADPKRFEDNVEFYNYYGIKLHHTRVIPLKGIRPPSFIRPRLRGWGFSVVESLVQGINQYFKSNNVIFEVMDEFKLDIFKIKGLAASMLTAEGFNAIQKRVKIANMQKNFQNALSMDSEDDYIQKQLTFSGLADMMKEFRIQIASDMRFPLTKLFGLSATGFSSGEDDIENYNSMVESEVRSKCKYEIVKLLEIRCQKLFGMVPDDLQIEFEPLRILSSEQQENVKTQQMNRVMAALSGGAIQVQDAQKAINKGDLLPIQVEITAPELGTDSEGGGDEPVDDMAKELGVADPGVDAPIEGDDDDAQMTNAVGAFEESKHKRGAGGQFGSGGSSARKKSKTGKDIAPMIRKRDQQFEKGSGTFKVLAPITHSEATQLQADFKDHTREQFAAMQAASSKQEKDKIRQDYQQTWSDYDKAMEAYKAIKPRKSNG